jgi:hypothetical protein
MYINNYIKHWANLIIKESDDFISETSKKESTQNKKSTTKEKETKY